MELQLQSLLEIINHTSLEYSMKSQTAQADGANKEELQTRAITPDESDRRIKAGLWVISIKV